MKNFSVETPNGTLCVTETPEKGYPGIRAVFIGKNRKEESSMVFEYNPGTNAMELMAWTPDDLDGDPSVTRTMSL